MPKDLNASDLHDFAPLWVSEPDGRGQDMESFFQPYIRLMLTTLRHMENTFKLRLYSIALRLHCYPPQRWSRGRDNSTMVVEKGVLTFSVLCS